MPAYYVQFHTASPGDFSVPYVRHSDSVVYECDGKEGTITFNGYYYVENGPPPYPEDRDGRLKRRYSEWLPKKLFMSLKPSIKHHKSVFYMIEVYKMEVYESTNEISEIDDEDGEPMKVCFFPTNRMKLWFRVLEDMNDNPAVKK
jgi:hypothetical protein